MFLYDCITNITNITNKFLEILYNYNYDYDYDYDYAIDKSQVIRCLDKEYMYDNYCDISIETCTSIQNNIIYDPNIAIYNNSIYNVKYLYISFYISSLFIIIYFCCIKTKQKVINITSNNISLLDEEAPILNNNYYLIDKNDTVSIPSAKI